MKRVSNDKIYLMGSLYSLEVFSNPGTIGFFVTLIILLLGYIIFKIQKYVYDEWNSGIRKLDVMNSEEFFEWSINVLFIRGYKIRVTEWIEVEKFGVKIIVFPLKDGRLNEKVLKIIENDDMTQKLRKEKCWVMSNRKLTEPVRENLKKINAHLWQRADLIRLLNELKEYQKGVR